MHQDLWSQNGLLQGPDDFCWVMLVTETLKRTFQQRLWKDPWNYFDSSLVLFWVIEKALSAYAVLDQGLLRCSARTGILQ